MTDKTFDASVVPGVDDFHAYMFDYSIVLVEHYSGTGYARYRVPKPAISLNVRGIEWYKAHGTTLRPDGPFLIVHSSDSAVEMSGDVTRLSYSIQVDTDGVRSGETGMVEVQSVGEWLAIPAITELTSEQCVVLEAEFKQLLWWYASPLPMDQLRVRLGFAHLLCQLISMHSSPTCKQPAARFKYLIDNDKQVKQSLESLSYACGYTPNYLRVLFQKQYGISPLAYRNHIRMERAVNLLHQLDLRIADIAQMTGFQHISHFSRLFRQKFGCSPREFRRRLQGRRRVEED